MAISQVFLPRKTAISCKQKLNRFELDKVESGVVQQLGSEQWQEISHGNNILVPPRVVFYEMHAVERYKARWFSGVLCGTGTEENKEIIFRARQNGSDLTFPLAIV